MTYTITNMNTDFFQSYNFTLLLTLLGVLGIIVLLAAASMVMYRYRQVRLSRFRRYLRNFRLKQLYAIATLFFLAMAASYWVLHNPLGWVYLLVAVKTGISWSRRAISL